MTFLKAIQGHLEKMLRGQTESENCEIFTVGLQ